MQVFMYLPRIPYILSTILGVLCCCGYIIISCCNFVRCVYPNLSMMTSSNGNGNIFCVTGQLFGEFTGQLRGALMFSMICARIKVWVSNREAGDLRRHRAHFDVIVMSTLFHSGNRKIEPLIGYYAGVISFLSRRWNSFRCLGARLQFVNCVSNGNTAVLHLIDDLRMLICPCMKASCIHTCMKL